ncbi:LPS export ABC transporter periplasmic protein LptC [Moheibacter stercoris]|uniref:LPS export ABC transporter protein LptC n=1 Tax=Moheibacter stercoris TaxID=1628251 RepID=A0ABV2LRV9_9FLAO
MANRFMTSSFRIRKRYWPLIAFVFLWTCTKTEDVDLSKRKQDFPSRTLTNAHVIFKDSGFIKIDLRSPLIEEFAMIDSPYTLFKKGLEMNFFNKTIDSPGYLRADWAMMNEMRGWYEGRGNVVVISEKGDTLKTEKLFWNKTKRLVFTQDTVFIISKSGDSLQANNGLEAKDDLTEYTLFNNQGIKLVKDENL